MNRDQLASRVSALIGRLYALRSSIAEASSRESVIVEMIDQERSHLDQIEGELERLRNELEQALEAEAYEDSYDDDGDEV